MIKLAASRGVGEMMVVLILNGDSFDEALADPKIYLTA